MRGPYVLSKYCVNMVVPPRLRGVYALSNSKDSMELLKRVDKSANEEIKNYVNQYKFFWVELASSVKDSFALECEAYHTHFAKSGNGYVHPKAPADTGWHCPVCNE